MSSDDIEHHLLPAWKTQVKTAHDHGVPVLFHSDGNLNPVLPHIAAAGFDGLQCIKPAVGMDIGMIQEQYGDSLCLMGNIDPTLLCDPRGQYSMERGEDVLGRAVAKIVAANKRTGGVIFGTCSGLHAGMRPDRVQIMYDRATGPNSVCPPGMESAHHQRRPARRDPESDAAQTE